MGDPGPEFDGPFVDDARLFAVPSDPSELSEDCRTALNKVDALSEEEIDRAEQAGFKSVALGPRVLRTETAPVVALSVLQHLWGDLGN